MYVCMDAPYREVVFCVCVVGDVHAKLSASPPWFLASDPGPCPPPSPPPLLSLPWPRRVPCPVSPLGLFSVCKYVCIYVCTYIYMHTNMRANSFLRLLYKLPLYKASIQGSSIRQCRCVRAVCRMAVGLIGNGTAEQFGRSMCCKKCI